MKVVVPTPVGKPFFTHEFFRRGCHGASLDEALELIDADVKRIAPLLHLPEYSFILTEFTWRKHRHVSEDWGGGIALYADDTEAYRKRIIAEAFTERLLNHTARLRARPPCYAHLRFAVYCFRDTLSRQVDAYDPKMNEA